MEESQLNRFKGIAIAVRKKRSQTSRRPKPDSQALEDDHDHLPLSTTPSSNDLSRDSSDEIGETSIRRKESSLSLCLSRLASSEKARKRDAEDGKFNNNKESRHGASNHIRSSEGVLSPANWRSTNKLTNGLNLNSQTGQLYDGRNGETQSLEQSVADVDGVGNDNRVKKVKLKVGGLTRTIHANSPTNGSSSAKSSQSSDISRSRQKQKHQEYHTISDRRTGLQGVPWKDFSGGGFSLVKEDGVMGRTSQKNTAAKQGDKSEPARKSKRVPKKHARDSEEDEDSADDEIRYLEKLKMPKMGTAYGDDDEPSKKLRKLSTLDKSSADANYEEEERTSEVELEGNNKKQKKGSSEPSVDGRREVALTTRQRALLQLSKDGPPAIEFPDGLPPPAPRKQKEKLTEVEQQLKRAEALKRRRMQVEKANREAEAEAIRKILGQDSNRKKHEDRKKKRQEELAQEKAANAEKLASSSIRWVMGPSGTVVTFPKDSGLPSIFSSKPCSYPPPREKCAGPSCTNTYKYRDSKTNLPLCSLQCYKAVQGLAPSNTTR